ncbi:MAG: NlpC/P60 family protein [Neomegalonema sp.]|nr:NlpC/P60 family protein [Neomegalonema sp.]
MNQAARAPALDLRLNAARPDLADNRLRGKVQAQHFVDGERAWIKTPIAPVRAVPDPAKPLVTEFLMGEPVLVFERKQGWAWAQSQIDGYTGYVPEDCLDALGATPNACIHVPRALIFPSPELRVPPMPEWLPMGAGVSLIDTTPRDGYLPLLGGGWIWERHVSAVTQPDIAQTPIVLTHAQSARDWVGICEQFEHAPYLWGGKSVAGIDCSGLIQLALQMHGQPCPRDTDLMEAALGSAVDPEGPLQRGDLIFWKGHIGVMLDKETLLHANAHHMQVAREPLPDARERILARSFGPITSVRRLALPSALASDAIARHQT